LDIKTDTCSFQAPKALPTTGRPEAARYGGGEFGGLGKKKKHLNISTAAWQFPTKISLRMGKYQIRYKTKL
jgi:hypothetical protein